MSYIIKSISETLIDLDKLECIFLFFICFVLQDPCSSVHKLRLDGAFANVAVP